VALLAVVLAACGGGSEAIAGTWAMEIDPDGLPADGEDRLTVREDLSISATGDDTTCAGTAVPTDGHAYRLELACGTLDLSLDASVGEDDRLTVRSPSSGEQAIYRRIEAP
jgi:hypothetical protein